MGTVCDNVVRFRIDSETKAKAAEALDCMGLTISDALRITLRRIAEEGRMPFDMEIPNARTRQAIHDRREGRTTRYETAEDALKDLGL